MDKRDTVAVLPCPQYERAAVGETVERLLGLLPRDGRLGPHSRVTVKPNLLMKRAPDAATTTHPEVVHAVICWLKQQGVRHITIADSPGGPYTKQALMAIYRASGMERVAAETGAVLNLDLGSREIKSAGSGLVGSFTVIEPLCPREKDSGCDYIVDICKLKTHCMTTLSGAVKNMFGSIPGLLKPRMHYRYPQVEDFAGMLVDLCQTVTPHLVVVDAIETMEGDGPSSGDKRQLGLLLAGASPFAVDVALCRLAGFAPEQVPTVRLAAARGLCGDDIEVVGQPQLLCDRQLKLPRSASVDFTGRLPGFLRPMAGKVLTALFAPRPRIDVRRCIGCGKCAESCPPQTIRLVPSSRGRGKEVAVIGRKDCIRCYCCHEMCPVSAISVSKNLLTRH